jgi:fimbrial chaperone protein
MTFLSKGKLRLLAASLTAGMALLLTPTLAHAQRVTPMSYELAPRGSKATTNLNLENTSQTDMTIELTASRVTVLADGQEERVPAEDDFLIFPPQTVIKAGKSQTIRVKYVGEPTIEESVPYRISILQVPVQTGDSGGGGVGLTVNFNTLAHVVPDGAKTIIEVTNIRSNTSGGWDLDLENTGSRMARLSRTQWVISSGDNTKTIPRQQVAAMTKRNLVMPGTKVTLSIPAIEGFQPGATTIDVVDKS